MYQNTKNNKTIFTYIHKKYFKWKNIFLRIEHIVIILSTLPPEFRTHILWILSCGIKLIKYLYWIELKFCTWDDLRGPWTWLEFVKWTILLTTLSNWTLKFDETQPFKLLWSLNRFMWHLNYWVGKCVWLHAQRSKWIEYLHLKILKL